MPEKYVRESVRDALIYCFGLNLLINTYNFHSEAFVELAMLTESMFYVALLSAIIMSIINPTAIGFKMRKAGIDGITWPANDERRLIKLARNLPKSRIVFTLSMVLAGQVIIYFPALSVITLSQVDGISGLAFIGIRALYDLAVAISLSLTIGLFSVTDRTRSK